MIEDQPESSRGITRLTLLVEFGLAAAALILGGLFGKLPLDQLDLSQSAVRKNLLAIALGVVATLPMLAILPYTQRSQFPPIVRLRKLVDDFIAPLFAGTTILQLALISFAAGVGEELFFRAFLQQSLAVGIGQPHGVWIGLIIASLIFGACHWLTTTYAVLATGIGIYMGLLLIATDNLIVPIVAHGLYDFVALLYLVRSSRTAPVNENA